MSFLPHHTRCSCNVTLDNHTLVSDQLTACVQQCAADSTPGTLYFPPHSAFQVASVDL